MARTIGATTDILLSRVRQSGSLAIAEDTATQVLTTCQQLIALSLNKVISVTNFTVSAQTLVFLRDTFTLGKVLAVHEDNRKLFHFQSFSDLSTYDIDWFHTVNGTRFEGWHQIGLDVFVIYPGKAGSSSISVTAAKATTVYTNYTTSYSTNLELSDEDVDLALLLSEAVLLTRSRKPETYKAAMADLKKRLGIDVAK